MKTNSSRQGGFSLVEALVAMTILGIAATSIMTTFSGSLIAGKTSEQYAIAVMLMDDLHNYVRSGQITPTTENMGTFANFPQYTWEVLFTLTEVTDLYQVDFFITWTRGDKIQQYQAVTYHYYPNTAASTASTTGAAQ